VSEQVAHGAVIRLAGGRVSARVHVRPVAVTLALAAATLVAAVIAIGTGDYPVAPREVIATLMGGGDPGSQFIVEQLRLPRVVCALLSGLALGISGAIFQTLTRNPLGSPDIIGFQTGAVTGALFVITVLEGAGLQASAGALAGGGVTALAVYLLALKHRRLSGFRLVLVGIAISALMLSVNDFLLSRARIEEAQEATRWLLGSLNGRTWEDAWPLVVTLALLLPFSALTGRSLRLLELGDDAAHGLGLRVERARVGLIALAVALVAVTTTAIGPVACVALTAPQIARRLTRTAQPPLLAAALTGALVVEVADIAAQRLVPSTPLPVGVMTGGIGGIYLIWLLGTEWRSGRA
jgi:iron complex transport system permease protein